MSKAQIHWLTLTKELGVPTASARASWRKIEAAYREPHRRYHVLKHLGQFLDHLERFSVGHNVPAAQRLAVFFHDIVYDPRAKDNEERSAKIAEVFLEENDLTHLSYAVGTLIRATASHLAATQLKLDVSKLTSAELWLFLDCDLLILAAKPRAYSTYVAGVAYEYSHLPPDVFAQGRAGFLEVFLKHEKIFHTEAVATLCEARARLNLGSELKQLRNRKS